MTDTCAASPASVRQRPRSCERERGRGGFKSSQLTAGACSEERKSQCQKRKCLTAWPVVVMILVQGPEQDSRRDHRLHACDSTPPPSPRLDTSGSTISGTERGFHLRAYPPRRQTSKQQG